jgi:hypothetical protein
MKRLMIIAVAGVTLGVCIIAIVMSMRGHLAYGINMETVHYVPGWNWQALVGFAGFAVVNAVALLKEITSPLLPPSNLRHR